MFRSVNRPKVQFCRLPGIVLCTECCAEVQWGCREGEGGGQGKGSILYIEHYSPSEPLTPTPVLTAPPPPLEQLNPPPPVLTSNINIYKTIPRQYQHLLPCTYNAPPPPPPSFREPDRPYLIPPPLTPPPLPPSCEVAEPALSAIGGRGPSI